MADLWPGDTLLIGLNGDYWEPDQLDELKKEIEDALPGIKVAVIRGAMAFAGLHPDPLAALQSPGPQDAAEGTRLGAAAGQGFAAAFSTVVAQALKENM